MLTKIYSRKRLAVLFITTFMFFPTVWSQNIVDMSEKFLKIQEPVMLYDLGGDGFAVYDTGDAAMKIFGWDFKLKKQFPLKKGEGPGEVKNFVASACIINGKFYILSFFDKTIKVFKQNGFYEKDIPFDFMPREVLYRRGKLYLFNLRINATEESCALGNIIDPLSGKKTKDIIIKNRLITTKTTDGAPLLIGMSSTFDVGDDGKIYMLISSANLLVSIDNNTGVAKKIELPYKERKIMRTVKKGDKEDLFMSVLDWYPDMRVFDGAAYVCFQKTIKENDKEGANTYQTVVIKVSSTGKFVEKVFDGECIIIGRHKGHLYLFNCREYKVVPVKMSDW